MLYRPCKGDTYKMRQVICFICLSLKCDDKLCKSPIVLENAQICCICGDISFIEYDIIEKGVVNE